MLNWFNSFHQKRLLHLNQLDLTGPPWVNYFIAVEKCSFICCCQHSVQCSVNWTVRFAYLILNRRIRNVSGTIKLFPNLNQNIAGFPWEPKKTCQSLQRVAYCTTPSVDEVSLFTMVLLRTGGKSGGLVCKIAPRCQESWAEPAQEPELIWWKTIQCDPRTPLSPQVSSAVQVFFWVS